MINKNKKEILYPGIVVFRNAIDNVDEIIQLLEQKAEWEPWYDVGKQIVFNRSVSKIFDTFPDRKEWDSFRKEQEERQDPKNLLPIINQLEEAFYEATSAYFEDYEAQQDNWMHGSSNILKYEGKTEVTTEAAGTKELTLPFHTDFYQANANVPGPQAEYTVTIYLNDDYVGGEIDYRIFNGSDQDFTIVDGDLKPKEDGVTVEKIQYRPQPGDIIIFPSRPPYYHGVRKVTEGTKRFVRMFWMSILHEEVN